MGFDDRDLRGWSVRDSGELWRKPFRLSNSSSALSQASSSVCSTEDSAEGLKRTASLPYKHLQKQFKLPPRSPRTPTPRNAVPVTNEPKLELTIHSLSPRPSATDENDGNTPRISPIFRKSTEKLRKSCEYSPRRWPASSLATRNKLDALQAKEDAQRTDSDEKKEEIPIKEIAEQPVNQCPVVEVPVTPGSFQEEDQETSLFSGMDLENQKDILTDESEIDFWDCQEESNYFIKPGLRDSMLLDSDDATTTTVCTLNGERVVMQTNIAYQHHTEQELTGYAQASREYLESQQHVMDYFEELQASDELGACHQSFEAIQRDSCGKKRDSAEAQEVVERKREKDAAPTFSVTSKRRWPRVPRSTTNKIEPSDQEKESTTCLSARSISSNASSGRNRRARPSKRQGKPVMRKCKNRKENSSVSQEENIAEEEKLVPPAAVEQQEADMTQQQSENHPTGPICEDVLNSEKREEGPLEEPLQPHEEEKKEDGEGEEAVTPQMCKAIEQEVGERNSLSAEKFCSILSFLKQVENTSCPVTKPDADSPRTVLGHEDAVSVAESTFTSASAVPRDADSNFKGKSADLAFSGIRNKIHELKDQIMKQKNRMEELEAEKEHLKIEKHREISSEREKYSKELQDQAQEYKAAIKKHLSISEKLMKDKEALSERCCSLAMVEAKFEDKMKTARQEWSLELRKQKEVWNAGEKSRRESWIEKKTKEIKEMTIVGLEPHIESIHESHRKQLEAAEERHNEEIRKQLHKQHLKHREEMSELREQLLKERDEILDKERLAAHSRINEMAEKYEQQALQQRMRIASDLALQLERSESNRRDDKQYTQELFARCQKESAEREETLRKQQEKLVEELQSKAEAELVGLKRSMDLERVEWIQQLHDRVNTEIRSREPEIEARCLEERNKEIEIIIDRMEKEKQEVIEEHKRERANRIEELLEEKKSILKKLKDSETKYMDLCRSALEGKAQADAERSELNSRADELRAEMRNQSGVISELNEQIGFERQEAKKQSDKLEASIAKQELQTKATLVELQKSRSEVEQVRIRKVEELAELENKVKIAIEKKDEIICGLRSQLEHAHHQIRHTEQLLLQEHNILFS